MALVVDFLVVDDFFVEAVDFLVDVAVGLLVDDFLVELDVFVCVAVAAVVFLVEEDALVEVDALA